MHTSLDRPPAYAHVTEEVEQNGMRPRGFLIWDPRTGKTRATTGSMRRWFDEAGISRACVMAPRAACNTVWGPELAQEGLSAVVLTEGTDHALKMIEMLKKYGTDSDKYVIVVNYDLVGYGTATKKDEEGNVLKREKLVRDALRGLKIQGWIFDECHLLRTPSASRSRAAQMLGNDPDVKFVRGLTGTLTPNGYENVYAQFKIVDPLVFGTNQTGFNDRYMLVDHLRHEVLGFKPEMLDEFRKKIMSISSLKFRDQCFTIPPVTENTRLIDLPLSAREAYNRLVKQHELEITGYAEVERLDHVLTRQLRLAQLASGFIHTDKEREPEWVHTALIDACVDEMQPTIDAGEKVVIFYRFKPERDKLLKVLTRPGLFAKKVEVGRVDGDTNEKTQTAGINAFLRKDSPINVMLCQEQAGSLSISLRTASHTIFFSAGYAQEVHDQARQRMFDQNHSKMTYTYLEAAHTVHQVIAKMRQMKEADALRLVRGTDYAAMAGGLFEKP